MGNQAHYEECCRDRTQHSARLVTEVLDQPRGGATVLPDVLAGPNAAHIFRGDGHVTYRKYVTL